MITTLSLPKGHRYLIFGSAGIEPGIDILISSSIGLVDGNIPDSYRDYLSLHSRGNGRSGGGCVSIATIYCTKDIETHVSGYGYDSTHEYNYTGALFALQLCV